MLWDQLCHLAKHLRPAYDAIYRTAFDETVLGADETGWPMLEKGRELWQVRCLTSPRLRYFRIVEKKDTKSALDLLTHPVQGVFRGVLVVDGAQAYSAARREAGNAFELAGCWAHARRYLLQAEPNFPDASEALVLIDELLRVDRQARASPGDHGREILEKRRQDKSIPVLDKLKKWLIQTATKWPGSDLNKAIGYIDNRWDSLKVFLDNPDVPLHNNGSEFALRRPVMGRRNFYGTKSPLGTQVAALFYTLLETARRPSATHSNTLLTPPKSPSCSPVGRCSLGTRCLTSTLGL